MPHTLAPPVSPSSVDKILAAAERLFAIHGFEAASMAAIAREAGVGKATVFYHFATKRELYLAVLAQACAETSAMLRAMALEPGGVAAKLAGFARHHLTAILEHEQFSRLILRELLEDGPQRGRELAQQGFAENFARLVGILRSAQAGGELRPDVDPAMAAVLLLGADVFFFEARDVLRHYPDVTFSGEPERFSRMMVDILLRGILDPANPMETSDENV